MNEIQLDRESYKDFLLEAKKDWNNIDNSLQKLKDSCLVFGRINQNDKAEMIISIKEADKPINQDTVYYIVVNKFPEYKFVACKEKKGCFSMLLMVILVIVIIIIL